MEPERQAQLRARRTLAGVLAALFAAMLLYRVLHEGHLEQTALFYVGIPAVIAITVALTARARSTTGMVMASITVALALAGPVLGEGIVCLVMAAPLFYLVGAMVGLFIDSGRRRERQRADEPLPRAAFLVAAVLEGTAASLPRDNEVSVTRATGRRTSNGRWPPNHGSGPWSRPSCRSASPGRYGPKAPDWPSATPGRSSSRRAAHWASAPPSNLGP